MPHLLGDYQLALPPFCRYVVMPVVQKLWQEIFVPMPAVRARR